MEDLGLGVIITSICIGCLFGAVYGWLALGISFVLASLLDYLDRVRSR